MKKMIAVIMFTVSIQFIHAQPKRSTDESAIRSVLEKQVVAWNEANIDEFMKGYWKSDSILFIGRKITFYYR